MQLHNTSLLQALGATQGPDGWTCPLHGDGAQTLRVTENPQTGVVYFDCVHSQCRFHGDAVSLVAAARKVSITEALAMLRPGGCLSQCLTEPLLEAEAAAYTESKSAQARVQAYLSKCQQALRQTPERGRFRTGLSQNTLRLVPAEVGLLVRGDDMPPVFRDYGRGRHQKANYVAYPYTYNGDVMFTRLQDPAAPLITETVTVVRDDIGVFMERFDTVPDTVVVAPDPKAAAIIYGNCMAEAALKPPVIAIAGFPLPESLSGVKTVHLMSTPETPLTLTQALQALSAPEAVAGAETQPQLRVWSTSCPAETVTAEMVRQRLHGAVGSQPLVTWTVHAMDKRLADGNAEEVLSALDQYPLTATARAALLDAARARNLSALLIDNLTRISITAAARLVLGNGKILRRTGTGIRAVGRRGDEDTLCNVGITVNHKIRTYTGEAVLAITVTAPDPAVPPLTLTLPESCWSKGRLIQKHIVKAFAARGQTPYVAVYDVPGYDWRDILCKLSEKCPLYTEVTELGLDEALDLHMPGFVVRTQAKTVAAQQQVFTLPQAPLRMYGGIPQGSGFGAGEAYRALFRKCDNMYVAAFTHGLMHIVYQATAGVNPGRSNWRVRAPRHLLYVETEAGIWQTAFRQLASFFSDSDYVPTLNFNAPEQTLDEYRQLGTLPVLARVPALRGDRFPRVILDSPVSLCGIVDSATAILSTGDLRTTYITPCSDVPAEPGMIAAPDLEELRQCFAGFLLEYVNGAEMDCSYRAAPIPSQAAYEAGCKLLGVEPQPLMAKIARRTFPSMGMNGVNTFFDVMHKALNALGRKPLFCVVTGKPPADASFTARGQHVFVMDDVVIVSKAVVELINADTTVMMRFDDKILTQELQERGLLAPCPPDLAVDMNRCWVLARKTWDVHVVRPPLWFPQQLTQDNVIRLHKFQTA